MSARNKVRIGESISYASLSLSSIIIPGTKKRLGDISGRKWREGNAEKGQEGEMRGGRNSTKLSFLK